MTQRSLPSGTVTFLFTDIEGSTKLLHELGPERYSDALAEHRRILREAFIAQGGVEVDTQGDAFFIAFPTATGAVQAAFDAQHALQAGPIRVRMGLHTGRPHVGPEGYVGEDVHKGARIAAAGHGGQVLFSKETRELVQLDVLDLGEHRLKDFGEPVWIFQLGNERFPPLKSISNTNLPRPASSFVGREREVRDVVSALEGATRLVTLTGSGGAGKTRLAIHAATELVPHFKNGVYWVRLASLRDAALVPHAIAETLGAKAGIAEHVGSREMLLVLDNMEQVIDAAPGLVALLERCQNLKLLVTSRERLRVAGEAEYAVPPLADAEAVELFCARSRLAPNAEIGALCSRLDNLPLAIELAAARTNVLSPAQILERLAQRLDLLKGGRDAEARQQTLRATIEWSHDLLDDDERTLFRRLAVFAGGCTLDAAERVTGADVGTLESLLDKSLLRRANDRYSMLETIREFAAERLAEDVDAGTVRRTHADYFVGLAEKAEPSLLGTDPGDWPARLEGDHDNIRAALDFLEASRDTQSALRLAGAVWEFWCLRSHYVEGFRRLEHLLALDEHPTLARAKALSGSAHLSLGAGAGTEIERMRAAQALELHRDRGDSWGLAFAEFQYAQGFAEAGDFATAAPLLEESARRLRDVGDEHRELQALRNLAWSYRELGDERHRGLYEEILRRARSAGDAENEEWVLSSLSRLATGEGRHREALTLMGEVYRLAKASGDPGGVDTCLLEIGEALAAAGQAETAVRLLSLADSLHEEIGWTYPSWLEARRSQALENARAALDETSFAASWEQGRKLNPDAAVEEALGIAEPA